MKFFRFSLCFLLIICQQVAASEPLSSSQVLEYAQQQLPLSGTLKNLNGFYYVDIDDGYIHQLIPFIQKEGFQTPPYFNDSDLIGAHITVVYPHEINRDAMIEISECGQIINFYPTACIVVYPATWEAVDQAYLISVESPELDAIRLKYGYPKKQFGFHVTIGLKPKDFNTPLFIPEDRKATHE